MSLSVCQNSSVELFNIEWSRIDTYLYIFKAQDFTPLNVKKNGERKTDYPSGTPHIFFIGILTKGFQSVNKFLSNTDRSQALK